MSVPNQTPYIIYNANGLTTVFPFEFYVINAGDIQVTINGTVITSGFSVSGVGNVGGGDVVFVTPPANGSVVMLERVVPTYRLTDYQDNGDLLADTVNKDFDRLWMAIQRSFIYLGLALRRPLLGGPYDAQGYRIEKGADPVNLQDFATKNYVDNVSLVRALRVPESQVSALPPVSLRANKMLAFNSEGQPIVVLPASGSASEVLIDLASSENGKGDALIAVKQPVPGALPRTQHLFNVDYVNVKDFGALGDGLATPLSSRYATLAAAQIDYPFVTDLSTPIDTAAIQAAWNAVTMKGVKDFPQHAVGESIYNWMSTKGPRLYIPAGSYKWSYPGLNLNDAVNQVPIFSVVTESKTSVEIDIGDNDNYFIDTAVNPYHFQIVGLKTYGGKGMIRCSSTAQNQTRISLIQDCTVSSYRECGIGFSSQDWPNIKIRNCQLYNRTGYQTIGIVMPGWSANSEIVGCEFGLAEGTGVYSYAIKLSCVAADAGGYRGPSTPILIADNSVYRRNSIDGSASVWIVPNPSTNDNAGRAVVFRNNKWGAENVNASAYHILIADENTGGTWGGNKRHVTTKSSGYVRGLLFDKNNIRFENTATQPYIASFTPHIQGLVCEDIVDNALPVMMLEYRGSMTYADFNPQDYDNLISTRYWLAPTSLNYSSKPVEFVSNFPATTRVIDEKNYLNITTGVTHPGQSDVVFRNLMTLANTAAGTANGVTKTTIDNSIGMQAEAASMVFSSNTARVTYPLQSWDPNRVLWLEIELQAGDTNPMKFVTVELVESDAVKYFSRVLNVTNEWRMYRIPVAIPFGATVLNLRVTGSGFKSGATTVKVGRVFAYHASEPISTGHLRSIGSAWNAQHITLGGYHLWVDGAGVLRIKNGTPTSGTDGTVVGSQT